MSLNIKKKNVIYLYMSKILNSRETLIHQLLKDDCLNPINNYCDEDNYYSILNSKKTINGLFFPIPITLCVDIELSKHSVIIIKNDTNRILSKMHVKGFFKPDLSLEIQKIIGCNDSSHPFYQEIMNKKDKVYIFGELEHIQDHDFNGFEEIRKTPNELREYFQNSGFKNIIGFQTRNPIHKSHYNLTIQAMKIVGDDSLVFLNPVSDTIQKTDIDIYTRVRCYKKLLDKYPAGRVLLNLLDYPMMMTGPTEALLHAIIRRNLGCTHFIVGRDHAGPSVKKQDGTNFYESDEAQNICREFENELGIKILIIGNMVYVEELDNYIEETSNLPYKSKNISGTLLRKMLCEGEQVPDWFSFPEVTIELEKYYKRINNKGICFYCVGLSGSGKTYFANKLSNLLQEKGIEKNISLLDADILRHHISYGLGFSREDRSRNVRRIGYLASEIVKHGGICIVSNIAPFQEDRDYNRKLIEEHGKYIEIFIDTPLSICEERDCKGIYKLYREGKAKDITGLDSPFDSPIKCNFTVNNQNFGEILQKCSELI